MKYEPCHLLSVLTLQPLNKVTVVEYTDPIIHTDNKVTLIHANSHSCFESDCDLDI